MPILSLLEKLNMRCGVAISPFFDKSVASRIVSAHNMIEYETIQLPPATSWMSGSFPCPDHSITEQSARNSPQSPAGRRTFPAQTPPKTFRFLLNRTLGRLAASEYRDGKVCLRNLPVNQLGEPIHFLVRQLPAFLITQVRPEPEQFALGAGLIGAKHRNLAYLVGSGIQKQTLNSYENSGLFRVRSCFIPPSRRPRLSKRG